jgi:dTDP-glucose pyrophosphorylase
VIDYYGDGSKFNVNITYVYQGRARGLADAVYKVKDLVGEEKFLVYLGDNLVNYDMRKFASFTSNASILLAKVDEPLEVWRCCSKRRENSEARGETKGENLRSGFGGSLRL